MKTIISKDKESIEFSIKDKSISDIENKLNSAEFCREQLLVIIGLIYKNDPELLERYNSWTDDECVLQMNQILKGMSDSKVWEKKLS